MPEAWETYYLMVGSSAGALIGLLFVVITLSGELDPDRGSIAQRTFLSPTIFHFVAVMVISCAAVVTTLPPPAMAAVIAIPGVVGTVNAGITLRTLTSGKLDVTHWTDYLYYGVLPAIGHVWLVIAAWAVWQGGGFGEYAVAAGAMALLLLGIRDAWDLATWLTYHKKG
ncbi:MAG TPA: hypothetical protein VHA70_13165 [Bauldia sp.]|nr:hypothetical protein [Bauldia sp.]